MIPGATAVSYANTSGKLVPGRYEYVRQAKTPDCADEWMSSNVFIVYANGSAHAPGSTETFEGFVPCATAAVGTVWTLTDDRDGKKYKVVMMPDERIWMAQNLNFTKDLMANAYSNVANGEPFTTAGSGTPAIGSYWCPPVAGSTSVSGTEAECNTYGALYTWETTMMVDGRCADETLTNCGTATWDESWVSSNYFFSGAPGSTPEADINNARGAVTTKGGGRGICPKGWHVPTLKEWAVMLDKVEGDGTDSLFRTNENFRWIGTDAGTKLKDTSFRVPEPGLPKPTNFNGVLIVSHSHLGVYNLHNIETNWHVTSVVNADQVRDAHVNQGFNSACMWVNYRSKGSFIRCQRN